MEIFSLIIPFRIHEIFEKVALMRDSTVDFLQSTMNGVKLGQFHISIHCCGGWLETCGQSYKHFMIVNYDSRVVPDLKILHITTLES